MLVHDMPTNKTKLNATDMCMFVCIVAKHFPFISVNKYSIRKDCFHRIL